MDECCLSAAIEAFLVALHVSCQIQLQVVFDFPNSVPVFLDCLCFPSGSPFSASTSCILLFCLSFVRSSGFVHAGLLTLLLGFLLIGIDHSWAWRKWSLKSTSCPGTLYFPGPYLLNFFQADPWTDHSLLFWSPRLLSCYLSCSHLSGSWAPLSLGHCSWGCPWPSHPFLLCL